MNKIILIILSLILLLLNFLTILKYLTGQGIIFEDIFKILVNLINITVIFVLIIKIKVREKLGESVYKTIINLSLDGIYIENDRGYILDCNQRGYEMFGFTKEEMLNLSVRDLVPNEFADSLPDIIPDEMATGDEYIERVNMKKNGSLFPTEINSKYVYINGKKRLIVFVRDITKKKELEDELKNMAMKDELTKVYNRRYILKFLAEETYNAKLEKSTLSIVLLDIDDFKRINDNYGHPEGDDVLIKFTTSIQSNLRKKDYLGRIGGEEFIIILPQTTQDEGDSVLYRIRETLKSVEWGIEDLNLTFSAGFLEVTPEINQGYDEKMLKSIDELMYRAKKCGKNCTISSSTIK